MKILIAEDDQVSQKLVLRALSAIGECTVVYNGQEAVDLVKSAHENGEPFDLICLDIMMPNMDGQTALKEIRKHEEAQGVYGLEGAKVIMLTALNDAENILGAFRSGCEAYLLKPIDRSSLLEKVDSLLKSSN